MYAVIATGGKQEKVTEGQTLHVELLGQPEGSEVTFTPILLVDGDQVLSTPGALSQAAVTAKVLGEVKGPKIDAFTYKRRTNQRKRWGHRQRYTSIEITGISKGA